MVIAIIGLFRYNEMLGELFLSSWKKHLLYGFNWFEKKEFGGIME